MRRAGRSLPRRCRYRGRCGARRRARSCNIARPTGRCALTAAAVPLRRSDGSLRGAVVTFRDETERVHHDVEQQQAAHFRERFIGILGHDLRSPRSAIMAGAGMILRQREAPDRLLAAAARISFSGERMARMISDLLDFTQARLGGGIAIHRKQTDMGELARAVVEEISAANPVRPIDLRVEGDVTGSFDPDRAAQLLSNLVTNAVTYAPRTTRSAFGWSAPQPAWRSRSTTAAIRLRRKIARGCSTRSAGVPCRRTRAVWDSASSSSSRSRARTGATSNWRPATAGRCSARTFSGRPSPARPCGPLHATAFASARKRVRRSTSARAPASSCGTAT